MVKTKLFLAPMLKVTTPHFRNLISLTSPSTILFTEMIVANTAIHAPLTHKLGNPTNTIVQLGGNDPLSIANAINIIKQHGFHDFNLNCGCPSSKVKSGCFGAVLMLSPSRVVDIINTVDTNCNVVLSVKCRIGVDENDSFEFFCDFVDAIVQNTKCRMFFVHCRKCILDGLSPKGNRTVPPLDYSFIERIRKRHPGAEFYVNGGIKGVDDMVWDCDGYMIGREAIKNPLVFKEIEDTIKKRDSINNAQIDTIGSALEYVDEQDKENSNTKNKYYQDKKNYFEVKNYDKSNSNHKEIFKEKENFMIENYNKEIKYENNNLTDENTRNEFEIQLIDIYYKSEYNEIDCDKNIINNNFEKNVKKLLYIKKIINEYLNLYEDKVSSHIVAPLMQLYKGNKGVSEFKNILNKAAQRKILISELKISIDVFFDKYLIK
ncbi:hypothetical protein COBT_000144 [Conglomerata obtusa]